MAKPQRLILGLTLLLCLLIAGHPASGSSPQAPRRSQYLVVSADDNWEWSPAVAYASQRNQYLVVWENVWPNLHHDIYGRLVGGDGHFLGPEFPIYSDAYNSLQPAVTYDSTHDQYLVVWAYDFGGDGEDNDIYGRFIPGAGLNPSESAFPIENSRENTTKPRVAYGLTYDEYMLVWKIAGAPSSIGGGLIHDDKTGSFVPISSGPEVRDFPDITYNLAHNEFVATWDEDVGHGGQDLDIYAVRLSHNGTPQPPGEFPVATSTSQEQHPTVAACDKGDEYLFVWQNQVGTTANENLYGRWMTGNGVLASITGIEGTTLPQRFPRLACNPAGSDYLLTWHDQYAQPLLRWGVWAKQIQLDRSMEPPFEVVRPSNTADRLYPALAYGKNGAALIAWQHARDDSSYLDIWAQMLWLHVSYLPIVLK
jgi:hypothetical protein